MSQPGQPKIRDPLRDRETLRRIEAEVQASNLPRAMDMARAALADGLVHAQLFNLRAHWLERQGRAEEALTDMERALALAQDKISAYTAYGFLLEKMRRGPDAAAAFEQAAALAPQSPDALFNSARANLMAGALEKAANAFSRLLELAPNHVEAMLRLSEIYHGHGDMAAAEEMANRALAIEPGQPAALAIIARIALEHGDTDAAERTLTEIAGPSKASPTGDDSVTALGLLGDVRHAQRRYADAFALYSEANQKKRLIMAPRQGTQESAISYLQWLIESFESARPSQWAAKRNAVAHAPDAPRSHVFLVGFPRSGTTLLENVLASHSDVVALEEKELMSDAVRAFLVNDRGWRRLMSATADELEHYRSLYWHRARGHGIDVKDKIFVDKHPLISTRLMLVTKLFPDAKILFAIRDPRDVVLSCYRRSFNRNFSLYTFLTLESTAAYYDLVMRLSKIEQGQLGLDWHDLRHESVVTDFETEMKKVCDFIGMEWSGDLMNFAERAQSKYIATPSALQVKRGLNTGGIGVWRNYRDQLAPILPILDPWVREFGYPAD